MNQNFESSVLELIQSIEFGVRQMHRSRIVLSLILVTASYSHVQSAEPGMAHWLRDASMATRNATERDVPLVVFVTSPTCTYCDAQNKAFNEPKLARLLQREFVPLALDVAHDEVLVGRLGIQAFPTTLIISPDGKVLARVEGYRKPIPMAKIMAESSRAYRKARNASDVIEPAASVVE
ncbi:MAG: thioredoxin family protein [Planctomycetaceae bacterium]